MNLSFENKVALVTGAGSGIGLTTARAFVGSWIVPIPGTRKLVRLVENIGAVAAELTPDDLREIGVAASKITVHGARYPEKLEQMTDR